MQNYSPTGTAATAAAMANAEVKNSFMIVVLKVIYFLGVREWTSYFEELNKIIQS